MKEFNLSEKIFGKYIFSKKGIVVGDDFIHKKDVKEFIRLLKESCKDCQFEASMIIKINALAGEKLIK